MLETSYLLEFCNKAVVSKIAENTLYILTINLVLKEVGVFSFKLFTENVIQSNNSWEVAR